jgi:signal transduction histidine kinase
MAALFSVLLAAIGVFMLAFFPARMATQATAATEQRATAIAHVTAAALGPSIEFDDADNARSILGWLAATSDAQFAIVRRADVAADFAVWHPEAVPPELTRSPRTGTVNEHEQLIVSVAIRSLGGTEGTLQIGFSLGALAAERDATRRTVGEATIVVFALGVLATMLLVAIVVRPIRRLTGIALQISRGELPPALPTIHGTTEVARMGDALRDMLARLNESMALEVSRRTQIEQQQAQLVETGQRLIDASRLAGMAEVAIAFLHNIGNALNSVNTSCAMISTRARENDIAHRLRRVSELVASTEGGLAELARDPKKASQLGDYLKALEKAAVRQGDDILAEATRLSELIEHIQRVVDLQRDLSKHRAPLEVVQLEHEIDQMLRYGGESWRGVEVVRSDAAPPVLADRQRILQILHHLINNARDAVIATARSDKRIEIRTSRPAPDRVAVEVRDNGIGIAAADLPRIFTFDFTTTSSGSGFGLHNSANLAREIGGSLTASSDGVGQGATFVFEFPFRDAAPGPGREAAHAAT